jgi:diketogulonate reductase-like aldo/keto reductase
MTAPDGNDRDHASVTLSSGAAMPLVGFGTWRLTGRDAYRAVRVALDVGYRLIDTATMYGNETQIGEAIRDSGIARHELFVTTKLPPENAGRERATIEASLGALGLEHVDLWLVHWPPGERTLVRTWQGMLAARDDGLATSVGVSNHSVAQIDRLVGATGEAPSVNQIPWAPSRFDGGLLRAMRERDVVLEGYSPFKNTNLRASTLVDIARRHAVTPAQVVLRWHVQHEVVVIPKSATAARVGENFDVWSFDLSSDEMRAIDALGR